MQSPYIPTNTINYPFQDSLDHTSTWLSDPPFQIGQPDLMGQSNLGMSIGNSSQLIMHPTYNPLPEQVRMQLVTILNQLVCDCLSLTYAAKQAHWNIKGQGFIAIHRLFDEVHDLGDTLVDSFAEMVTTLGGQAMGTIDYATSITRLAPFPLTINDSKQLIIELTERLAAVSQYLIEAIGQTETLDKTTQNELMNAQVQINKKIYFLESHLH